MQRIINAWETFQHAYPEWTAAGILITLIVLSLYCAAHSGARRQGRKLSEWRWTHKGGEWCDRDGFKF